MADEPDNDDQWLYGDNEDSRPPETPQRPDPQPSERNESPEPQPEPIPTEQEDKTENEIPEAQESERSSPPKEVEIPGEDAPQNGEGSDKEDLEEDSDDDDGVNVVIGDIKTSPAYGSLNIKRGGLLTSTGGDKTKQPPQSGKFTVEEFDQVGMINGVSAAEFNLDSLEDKPWRKPGADITDYFNYGFNEDTWRAYCERQKRLRVSESGVGLAPLNAIGLPRGPLPIMNDNSKYSGNFMGVRKAGPPPGRRTTGSIDVIGGAAQRVDATGKLLPVKENIIQVMTADRREYSRKPPGFPDMSVPPPTSFEEFQPDFGFNPEPEPFYGGYEPTQDVQWGTEPEPTWQASQDIKLLTTGPTPPVTAMGPNVSMPLHSPISKDGSPGRDSKEREREESRSRSDKRDRERSHRRERSRSRSRRHKSRSRSPGHRSHRKKKSRRHEDSD